MIRLNNIVVSTDFGEAAESALAYGRELARTFGGTLHVFHAADNVMTRFPMDVPFAGMAELQTDLEDAAKEKINALLTDEDRVMLGAKAVVWTSLSPATAIVDFAREVRADIVLVGTHGRGAVGHFFLGSVAERVVRTAPCPVLTVHHPEREFIAPDALVAVARD
jgi:nucleotide-binding universal stress UspA family protein